jgi:hypothetical protein
VKRMQFTTIHGPKLSQQQTSDPSIAASIVLLPKFGGAPCGVAGSFHLPSSSQRHQLTNSAWHCRSAYAWRSHRTRRRNGLTLTRTCHPRQRVENRMAQVALTSARCASSESAPDASTCLSRQTYGHDTRCREWTLQDSLA